MSTENIKKLKKATHEAPLNMGGQILNCYIVNNKDRFISQRSLLDFLGIKTKNNPLKQALSYVTHPALKGPIYLSVIHSFNNPHVFVSKNGLPVKGYEANTLIDYCKCVVKAYQQKILGDSDLTREYVHNVNHFLMGLASVGLVALIDEATGFQKDRGRTALQEILDKYLHPSFAPWTKTFPDEFYRQMYRLKQWEWGKSIKKPSVIGHYTNDLVYKRLAPGILEELRQRNPCKLNGSRSRKHHQHLSTDIGHTELQKLLHTATVVMRMSHDWDYFKKAWDKAMPRIGDTYMLALEESYEGEED